MKDDTGKHGMKERSSSIIGLHRRLSTTVARLHDEYLPSNGEYNCSLGMYCGILYHAWTHVNKVSQL